VKAISTAFLSKTIR